MVLMDYDMPIMNGVEVISLLIVYRLQRKLKNWLKKNKFKICQYWGLVHLWQVKK